MTIGMISVYGIHFLRSNKIYRACINQGKHVKVNQLFDCLSGNFTSTTLLQLCGFSAVVIPMQEVDNTCDIIKESSFDTMASLNCTVATPDRQKSRGKNVLLVFQKPLVSK